MVEVMTFVGEIIFEVIFIWTGEILLFVFTFGRHRPRWNLYGNESPIKFVIFSEITAWLGLAFWIILSALILKYVLGA
jgi:hypothetical protein